MESWKFDLKKMFLIKKEVSKTMFLYVPCSTPSILVDLKDQSCESAYFFEGLKLSE